jgi:hypothetical protein
MVTRKSPKYGPQIVGTRAQNLLAPEIRTRLIIIIIIIIIIAIIKLIICSEPDF